MKLKDCCTIIAGQSPESRYYNSDSVGLPFFQGKADFGELYPSIRVYCSQPTKIAEKDDILLSVRAPVGPTNLAPCKVCIGRGLTAIRPNDGLLTKYLLYYFKYYEGQLQAKGTGTTFKAITQDIVKNLEINVPDVVEQQRIVARIEELFSQLDDAEATLQKTKAQLALYRQAVLKSAFEGNLTVGWREQHLNYSATSDYKSIAIDKPVYKDIGGDENEISLHFPTSWLKLRIGDVFHVEVGATPSRRVSNYWNGDLNWVSSGEVQFNHIYETEERITDEGLAHASTKVQPVGTIMLAMIGEGKTRGQAAILEVPAAHNQNTAAIQVSATPCDPKYVYYYLLLNYENTRRVGSGNNQKALNKERVRALGFPFPSFKEQTVIVGEIESRLSIYEKIMETINAVLEQSKAIRQSIMKELLEGTSYEKKP